jgi:sugar phosphate isomerase/epimerase
MTRTVKACCGTWCVAFGLDRPAALEQTLRVISAFGYDGIELAGFHDHATIERYQDTESRRRFAGELAALELEPVAIAPDPTPGIDASEAWVLTGDQRALRRERDGWSAYLELAAELGIRRMRIDNGASGPLPYEVEYGRVWERTAQQFAWLAERGAENGCVMLWEMESGQPFNKPSEIVRLLEDVDHPNCKLLYDTAHFHAATELGHNQVQPAERWEGGQAELIRRLQGHIGHVHLCDTDGNVARNWFASKLGFGKGIIDFDRLLPVLAECYDGAWWGVDAIPLSSDAWGACWDGLFFVREVVAAHVADADTHAETRAVPLRGDRGHAGTENADRCAR